MISLLLLIACAAPQKPASTDTTDDTSPPPGAGETGETAPPEDTGPRDSGAPDTGEAGRREVIVHLFEWRWDDIAEECERSLGPAGYGAVQVSPPQEHALIDGNPWWERYQPVAYQLASRSGDSDAFAEMVARCAAVDVAIYVDAVINHMAWGGGAGSGGTSYGDYSYGEHYTEENFHDCRRGISDWGNREEIQNCELATLPDLATEQEHVRGQLSGYLQSLLDLGVAGFRVDAAKHMPAEDLAAIFGAVSGAPSVFQEILSLDAGDVIQPSEYTHIGRVTELRYGMELSRVFQEDQLVWLGSFGEVWGMMPSQDALVFIDNHDNQRGHGAGEPLTYKDGGLYQVANVFMLAWPYGRPKVMSSYAFDDGDVGPPRDGEETLRVHDGEGGCREQWVCEHRWPGIAGMVGFRNVAGDAPVENWWSNDNDQIAFSRGDRAFVVINREEKPTLTRTFQTGLPEGRYCDVITGARVDGACTGGEITIDASGEAALTVGPLDAVATHAEARL